MKHRLNITGFRLLTATLCVCCWWAAPTMATSKFGSASGKLIDVDWSFSERDTATGNVELLVNIRSERPLGNTRIHITPWYGVMVGGDTLWREDLTENNELSLTCNLFVPANDTSGVGITIVNRNVWGSFSLSRFFVTTSDTLEIYDKPPWHIMYQYHPGELKRLKYGPFELLVARKPPTEQISRITLQFAVWTNPDRLLDVWSEHGPWGRVHMTFVPGNGMSVRGKTAWIERHPNSGRELKEIDLTVERGDTCQATLITSFRDSSASIDLFFVNTCDSIAAWAGDPAANGRPITYNPPDWKHHTSTPTDWRDWLADTVFVQRRQERLEAHWQFNRKKMEEYEQSACEGMVQHFEIEGQFWQRTRGETKFRPVLWPDSNDNSAAGRDGYDSSYLYPMVLDLSKYDRRYLARQVVSTLVPFDTSDFHYARLPLDLLPLVLECGIPVFAHNHYPELVMIVDLWRPLRNRLMPLTITDKERQMRALHLTLNLSKSADYDFVSCICSDLESLDREGFYHGLIPWENLIDLRQRKIDIALYPDCPAE